MAGLRLYNVGIFGRAPDGSARRAPGDSSGAVDPDVGYRFGPEDVDEFEERFREAAEGRREFSSRPALLGGEELGLRVTVPAEDDVDAYVSVREFYVGAFRAAFGTSPEVDECEVILQEKFEEREERQLAEERVASGDGELELLGTTGAARVLGVTEQRVGTLEKARAAGRRHDFPAPRARTDGRPGWLPDDIQAFGRLRRKSGVHVTRRPPRRDALSVPGLRTARMARDWSQGVLEEKSGVRQTTISRLENGMPAGMKTRVKLARALEVGEEDLLSPPTDEASSAGTGSVATPGAEEPPSRAVRGGSEP